MAQTLMRWYSTKSSNIVAECVGIALVAPALWFFYGIATYFGAVFPGHIFWALVMTSVIIMIGAVASYDKALAHDDHYPLTEFVGDALKNMADTFMLWVGVGVLVWFICFLASLFL